MAGLLVLWSCLVAGPALAQSPQPKAAPPAPPAAAAPPAAKPAAPPPPAGPTGVWLDDTGRGAVEIKACGASLCGNIYWLQEPFGANGRPITDGYNPDAAKRTRTVCGLQVIGNVRALGDGTWDEGWVYDPKVGKSFDVAIALESRDRLIVTGYKGIKLLSKKLIWTRAPANLPRCDQTLTEKAPAGAGAATAASSKGAADPKGTAGAAARTAVQPANGAGQPAATAGQPAANRLPPPARAATTPTPPPAPARQ
jgi:uncharacterized protein (DUF2147 family)